LCAGHIQFRSIAAYRLEVSYRLGYHQVDRIQPGLFYDRTLKNLIYSVGVLTIFAKVK
jgi:hypothetical protein